MDSIIHSFILLVGINEKWNLFNRLEWKWNVFQLELNSDLFIYICIQFQLHQQHSNSNYNYNIINTSITIEIQLNDFYRIQLFSFLRIFVVGIHEKCSWKFVKSTSDSDCSTIIIIVRINFEIISKVSFHIKSKNN